MKLFTLLLLGINTVFSISPQERFNNWVKTFSIELKDTATQSHIFNNWLTNDQIIRDTNAKNLSYTLAHNAFSGYSQDEFRELMSLKPFFYPTSTESLYDDSYLGNELPESVDWREKGVVNPIKDQGQCGSCWAFSAIQAVESAVALKTGTLYNLSEQQLVDCDDMDFGCSGGWMDNAFSWINQNNGLCSEDDYPYVSGNSGMSDKCLTTCNLKPNTKVLLHVDIPVNSDESLMDVLSLQPVSVAIEADQTGFQFYSSGVFTGTCGTVLDHGVGLVGYGVNTTSNLSYYILRNSWGTSWGDNGYMYIGRGNDPLTNKPYNDGKGQCGVLTKASYPVL